MEKTIDDAAFGMLLRTFKHTAFRLELQPAYNEPDEQETLDRFLMGSPEPPTNVPGLAAWFDQVARLASEGKQIERVRVHEDPPTAYQRWERWIGQWNIRAGEIMRYMTRERAHEIGLLPDAGDSDWWLLDSDRLIQMRFDTDGRRIQNTLVTDPVVVAQATAWRNLAIQHAEIESADPRTPVMERGA